MKNAAEYILAAAYSTLQIVLAETVRRAELWGYADI
jgi:hypothetical protein